MYAGSIDGRGLTSTYCGFMFRDVLDGGDGGQLWGDSGGRESAQLTKYAVHGPGLTWHPTRQ